MALIERLTAVAGEVGAALGEPLAYTVSHSPSVQIWSEPSNKAAELASLGRGSVVHGIPAGPWLLVSKEELARIKGTEMSPTAGWIQGRLLQPCWAVLSVDKVYAQALRLSWPGVPGEMIIKYTVQWMPESEDGAQNEADIRTCSSVRNKQATAHGIPEDSSVQVRVIAHVRSPMHSSLNIQLTGSWYAARSAKVPDLIVEGFDFFNKSRGSCQSCNCCPSFLRRANVWGAGSSIHDCERCGCPYSSHLAKDFDPEARKSRKSMPAAVGRSLAKQGDHVKKIELDNSLADAPEDGGDVKRAEQLRAKMAVRKKRIEFPTAAVVQAALQTPTRKSRQEEDRTEADVADNDQEALSLKVGGAKESAGNSPMLVIDTDEPVEQKVEKPAVEQKDNSQKELDAAVSQDTHALDAWLDGVMARFARSEPAKKAESDAKRSQNTCAASTSTALDSTPLDSASEKDSDVDFMPMTARAEMLEAFAPGPLQANACSPSIVNLIDFEECEEQQPADVALLSERPRPGPRSGNARETELAAENQYLRLLLSDAHEELRIHKELEQERLAEKQRLIDDLMQRLAEMNL